MRLEHAIFLSLFVASNAAVAFNCDKKFCKDMTSCEEACHQLAVCGFKTLDGDGNGVPCENVCSTVCPQLAESVESTESVDTTPATVTNSGCQSGGHAHYNPATGEVYIPYIDVPTPFGTQTYEVYLIQQPSLLTFDLDAERIGER
jgi:hypothetical protein